MPTNFLIDQPVRSFEEPAEGECGEHDREVGVDRLMLVAVDRFSPYWSVFR